MSKGARSQGAEPRNAVDELAARAGIKPVTLLRVALALLTLAVYAQVCRFEFITIDDPLYVSTNPHVQYGLSVSGIKWAFTKSYMANWIPFTWISLMLDASAYEAWPGGYHITNVVLHLANVLLLFHVLRKATGQDFSSAFVAALFAVHPIHAESVAWVSERKDVLSIFFGLLSLSAYVGYAQQKRAIRYWLSLLLFLGSLLAKQTLVTLPFVLLLLDYWPLSRLSLRAIAEKVPFLAVSATVSVVAYLAQANGATVRSLDSIPIALRLATAPIAYVCYLQKAVIPWNLGVYYPYSTDVSLVQVAAAIAGLGLVTAAAIVARRRYPFCVVGWFWFLGTLVPMIGFVQVGGQQMADRYAYFSFIGLYLVLAGLVTSRRAAIAVVAAAAVLGFIQVGYWRDTLTLANHTLSVTNDNPFIRNTIADALIADGRDDEALEQYRQAVLLEPANAATHCKFGEALLQRGQAEAARREFDIAIALDDKMAGAFAGLGWFYAEKKQDALAKQYFERALAADPDDQNNFFNLALLCRVDNDFNASIAYCRQALKLNDDMISAHHLIADDLRRLGRPDEADAELRYTLSIAPYDSKARELLEKR